jgi:hypothetical protein
MDRRRRSSCERWRGGGELAEPSPCEGSARVYGADASLCFDASLVGPFQDAGEVACAFVAPARTAEHFDRLSLFYRSENDWFEVQRLPDVESCRGGGGWYPGYDDSGEHILHINVCACTCDALTRRRPADWPR